MTSRIISLSIAIGYMVTAYLLKGREMAWLIGIIFGLPISLIWFSDGWGRYTGGTGGGIAFTSTTPAPLVSLCGWVLLLLPGIIGIIMYFIK